jgi:hypothetical protein
LQDYYSNLCLKCNLCLKFTAIAFSCSSGLPGRMDVRLTER